MNIPIPPEEVERYRDTVRKMVRMNQPVTMIGEKTLFEVAHAQLSQKYGITYSQVVYLLASLEIEALQSMK